MQKVYFALSNFKYSSGQITFALKNKQTFARIQVYSVPGISRPGELLSLLKSSIYFLSVKINICKDF